MRISLNWLSDYIDVTPIRSDLQGVLSKLTMRGLEVEAVQNLSAGFDKVIVAQIEVRDKHPKADRLSVCRVNTGTETLQIVCGAQNMKAGDKVALSMIGACLPNGMKIDKGKIRDVESFGMLCSETELGISDTSEGILILPTDAPLGKPVAEVLGRDDIVFDLNVTPNRGDALSHIGVARELAAILGQRVKLPVAPLKEGTKKASEKIQVTLHNPAGKDLCFQYHGRFIEGIKVGPSPAWMVKRLQAVGLRSINNVVDVTNYVLMEWGTPLHAFDYAHVKGGHIHVRQTKDGDDLPLLDGTHLGVKDILSSLSEDLVIADNEKPIALAGVMGGGNSEVTEATTSILLEAAQFLPATVRATAKRFQKHSDSSYRFERQIDAKAVLLASERAASLLQQVAGGTVYSGVVSSVSETGKQLTQAERKTSVSFQYIRDFIGADISESEILGSLEQVGFSSKKQGEKAEVNIPSYRPDVSLREDIAEEVLRVWGFDRVPAHVPRLDFIPEPMNAVEMRSRLVEKLKATMVSQGFYECVNFAFTSKTKNDRWGGLEKGQAVTLLNPLNEEFTTLKTSLMTGLFENFVNTMYHQQQNVRLFEVRPVFVADESSETGVREEWRFAAIASGRAYQNALQASDTLFDFYEMKGAFELALESINCRGLRYEAWTGSDDRLHPAQAAKISLGKGPCGFLSRLHPKIEAEYKLREPVYLFECSLDRILSLAKTDRKASGLSKFPKVSRDLSLIASESMVSDKILQTVQKLGKPLLESVRVVDLYVGEKIPAGCKSLSIAMIFGDSNRTLEEAEIDGVCQKILQGLELELGVKLRLQ